MVLVELDLALELARELDQTENYLEVSLDSRVCHYDMVPAPLVVAVAVMVLCRTSKMGIYYFVEEHPSLEGVTVHGQSDYRHAF